MPRDDRPEPSERTPPGPSSQIDVPAPRFDHLRMLTGRLGLWEHAEFAAPRVEHGFCTDDNARALVVVARHTGSSEDLSDIAAIYLRFVLDARTADGGFHNRRNAVGEWTDEIGSDDCQGRAWWGLGELAHRGPAEWMRRAAQDRFGSCRSFESPHLRANAYAALGAVEMLAAEPGHEAARDLLVRTSGVVAAAARSRIPWPEVRTTYDNARLPEALLAAGPTLGDRRMVTTGLRLLEWLVAAETCDSHFSFTPTTGWSIGETRPGFDQQPLEAWAMADACRRAATITGDEKWRVQAGRAAQWLMGRNDTGMLMYDRNTGSTHDGLMDGSVNANLGAESTLAGIGALQTAAGSLTGPPDVVTG